MMQTLPLLLSLFLCLLRKDYSVISQDTRHLHNVLEVPYGRSIPVDPDLHLKLRHLATRSRNCFVRVIRNDPLTQVAGKLRPSEFDCAFDLGHVKYVHYGSLKFPNDRVRLLVRYDTPDDVLVIPIVLRILVTFQKQQIVTRNLPLHVNRTVGISEPLDENSIAFRYETENQTCAVSFVAKTEIGFPMFGEIVSSGPISTVMSCHEFLDIKIRYRSLESISAEKDFLVFRVTVRGSSGEIVHEEYFQVVIVLRTGVTNSVPRPSFKSLLLLEVNQFVMTALTPKVLTVDDEETPADMLILNVTKALKTGQGELISTDDSELSLSCFYQKDLKDLKIAYRPPSTDSAMRRTFKMELLVIDSDGVISDPFTLTIVVKPMRTLSPIIVRNTGLTLFEGQSRILKANRNFQVADEDDLEEVTVEVIDGLRYGSIVKDSETINSFLATDLESGNLSYVHDGSDTYTDNVLFRVSDKKHQIEILFPVVIFPVDDQPPVLITNLGLYVRNGGLVQISPDVLSAADQDSDDQNVIFQLQEPFPDEGDFLLRYERLSKVHNQIKESEDEDKDVVRTWTQNDIVEGRLFYRLRGEAWNRPTIQRVKFILKDKREQPNTSSVQEFTIQVEPFDNLPPRQFPGTTNEMQVEYLSPTPITKEQLRYMDLHSQDRSLLIRITRKPFDTDESTNRAAGRLVLTDDTDKEVTEFTQAQVNHHKISYLPPLFNVGLDNRIIQFHFEVSDSNDNVLAAQTFTITLKASKKKPPAVIRSGVKVAPREAVSLTPSNLNIQNSEKSTSSIRVNVLKVPDNGVLKLRSKNLTAKSHFTVEDISSNELAYSHNGDKKKDEFVLEVNDGLHTLIVPVTVLVEEQRRMFEILNFGNFNHTWSVRVPEYGKTSLIFGFSNVTSIDPSRTFFTFSVVTPPEHGHLEVSELNKNRFDLKELQNNLVQYVHNGKEIGLIEIYDKVELAIESSSNNEKVGSEHKIIVNVIIEPVDNSPPAIVIVSDILVKESQNRTFANEHIRISDADTDHSNIMCTLVVQPVYGYIESSLPLLGFERSRKGFPITSFVVSDLQANALSYVQSFHTNIEPREDIFSLSCSDGKNGSPLNNVTVRIEPVNDEVPIIHADKWILEEGADLRLNQSYLQVLDLDSPSEDDLTFSVSEKPKHGCILNHGIKEITEIDNFTASQVWSGKIFYRHDGSETTFDSVVLKVSDGIHSSTNKIFLSVVPVDDETPRIIINRGLQILRGENQMLTRSLLQADDLDSDNLLLRFLIRQPPKCGRLAVLSNLESHPFRSLLRNDIFTQKDLDDEKLIFVQSGSRCKQDSFTFDLTDGENTLLNQKFEITILTVDRAYPEVVSKSVTLPEGGRVVLTTNVLNTTDVDSDNADLRFLVIRAPSKGHLESIDQPGFPLTTFTQLMLAGNKISYVHDSRDETKSDSFTFQVTDGYNSVYKDFIISITDVNNKRPVVFIGKLKVFEGGHKNLSPFEINVEDEDTKSGDLKIIIRSPPTKGKIVLDSLMHISVFSMSDVVERRISYVHDSSESTLDSFTFVVTDGTHKTFFVHPDLERERDQPVLMNIQVVPVDNKVPVMAVIEGTNSLGSLHPESGDGFVLSPRNLRAVDADSHQDELLYVVTYAPNHGTLTNWRNRRPLANFTQGEVNRGQVIYRLSVSNDLITADTFSFFVQDPSGNRMEGSSVFQITWAWVSLQATHYVVNETESDLTVHILRWGNLDQSTFVSIGVRNLTAVSGLDFVQRSYSEQIQFEPGQTLVKWTVAICDDNHFEGREAFQIFLYEPVSALLGSNSKALINILDDEDESRVSFENSQYLVKESEGEIIANVIRTGDLSREMAVCCTTIQGSAKGSTSWGLQSWSDFQSRPESASCTLMFRPGESLIPCRVRLVDDALHENKEEDFSLILTSPFAGRIGNKPRARVVILDDLHDAPQVAFEQTRYHVNESQGVIEVVVLRKGPDLSRPSSVFVRSRDIHPVSAQANKDYVPVWKLLHFEPGVQRLKLQVWLLEDPGPPVFEGTESFQLSLDWPTQLRIGQPSSTTITIDDFAEDAPVVQFQYPEFEVSEESGSVVAMVMRTGDPKATVSVRCYTRQGSALAGEDFAERPRTNTSLIVFSSGEKIKPCKVALIDDQYYEREKVFRLMLELPGRTHEGLRLGSRKEARIIIKDNHDRPRIIFKKEKIRIAEPRWPERSTMVDVQVLRTGDVSGLAQVRVHTQDGSAKAGRDYGSLARDFRFAPNSSSMSVRLEIFSDQEEEQNEAFSLVLIYSLEPDIELVVTRCVVVIEETHPPSSGAVTFPSRPIVAAMKNYESGGSLVDPIPGHPAICVTSCNPRHPDFSRTSPLCTSQGLDERRSQYRWRVAPPTDMDGRHADFLDLEKSTFFSDPHSITLDSVYFASGWKLLCLSRAVDLRGVVGLESSSEPVVVGSFSSGSCTSDKEKWIFGAPPFVANIRYTGTSMLSPERLVEVRVSLPHRDGLLPILSTRPLENLELVVTEGPLQTALHRCSNMVEEDRDNATTFKEGSTSLLRGMKAFKFYRHLDLDACKWTFKKLYTISELSELCGAKVKINSEMPVQNMLTLELPLYVSNAYFKPWSEGLWIHTQLQTKLRISFVYDTSIFWQKGITTLQPTVLQGHLYPSSMRIEEDGCLLVTFMTKPDFVGMFVLNHTASDMASKVFSEDHPGLSLQLTMNQSPETYAQPEQKWTLKSDYAIGDYSGTYQVCLVPCVSSILRPFRGPDGCTPAEPVSFQLPIQFQQISDPVPHRFSLETTFLLTNKREQKTFGEDSTIDPSTEDVIFTPDDEVYGRIFLSDWQIPRSFLSLSLDKCFLCSGVDGSMPRFDPDHQQFGCLRSSPLLRHSIKIVDKWSPESVEKYFQGVPFDAQVQTSQSPLRESTKSSHSAKRGPEEISFKFNAKPLFQVSSGTQWFIQCIYRMLSTKHETRIEKRSSSSELLEEFSGQWDKEENEENKIGTNMRTLSLDLKLYSRTWDGSKESMEGPTNSIQWWVIGSLLVSLGTALATAIVFFLINNKKEKRRSRPIAIKSCEPEAEPCLDHDSQTTTTGHSERKIQYTRV